MIVSLSQRIRSHLHIDTFLSAQTRFPPTPAALFKHLPPDALLRVRCFDGEPVLLGFSTGRLKPKRLLGEITVSASHLQARSVVVDPC